MTDPLLPALVCLAVAVVAYATGRRRGRREREATYREVCGLWSGEIARRVRAETCARQRGRKAARLMTRAKLADGHGEGRLGGEWAAWRGN
jgi:hypothetical protein